MLITIIVSNNITISWSMVFGKEDMADRILRTYERTNGCLNLACRLWNGFYRIKLPAKGILEYLQQYNIVEPLTGATK